MLFSSNIFLFVFLPLAILSYFAVSLSLKNIRLNNLLLLILSLGFYYWGNGKNLILLIGYIILNLLFADFIRKTSIKSHKKFFLGMGIALNLSLLIYYKYFYFFVNSFYFLFMGEELTTIQELSLPVGISFYTFMAISYLIEIYRKELPDHSFIDFGMYLSLFPHLVAGPIVRYSEISKEIKSRDINLDKFFEGVYRFALGLGQKVIIADNLALVVDKIFSLSSNELTSGLAWLGAFCYTFQIYYDFSGYTGMAIGLAKMFGFDFPENFNQPYRSHSVTEFWRRWHMTLSRWFRDFLYLPLGGNRQGVSRTYINLFIVFLITGLWHGAAWTFVIWGIYHGVILIFERELKRKFDIKFSGFPWQVLSFVLVMVGWVIFRSESIGSSYNYIVQMFKFSNELNNPPYLNMNYYLSNKNIFLLAIAMFFAFFPVEKISNLSVSQTKVTFVKSIFIVLLLLLSITYLADASYNPFIYFRF